MPQRTLPCQLGIPATGDSRLISPRTGDTQCPQPTQNTHTPTLESEHSFDYSAGQAPVRGAAQEVANTASRRTGPRRWLRAVEWLIAAGLHGRANATTLTIAQDLAQRMDYDTGHVRYRLNDMVERLGLSRGYICKQISYLRELGALAWVQHGNSTNLNRLKGLLGYAGTATVYAAVIPPVYDHAMGHTVIGTGYEARVIIDQRGQQPTIPAQRTNPVDTAGNLPVENPSSHGEETPSLTWLKKESQVQVESGSNYTEQARPPKTRIPHQSTSINGRRRTAADVHKAGRTTRLVRALVNWTQPVPLRRLEFVLRPWTDRGWDACRIADELNGMCAGVRWKPKNPVAFIRARIAQDTAHQEELARAVAWEDSTAYREMADRASLAALFGPATPEPAPEAQRTDEDRIRARLDWSIWPEVADHYADDPDDALDLYGTRLCTYAVGKAARLEETYA